MRKHLPQVFEAGGGGVDLMVELLSCFRPLPCHAPLVAFGVDRGRWTMWTKRHAESALRQVASLSELQPTEYALHSLRIGGATHLATGGALPEDLRRGTLGKSDWVTGRTFVVTVEMPSGALVSWRSACVKWCSSQGKARSGGQ